MPDPIQDLIDWLAGGFIESLGSLFNATWTWALDVGFGSLEWLITTALPDNEGMPQLSSLFPPGTLPDLGFLAVVLDFAAISGVIGFIIQFEVWLHGWGWLVRLLGFAQGRKM